MPTNIGEGGAIKGVFLRREILEPVDLSKEGVEAGRFSILINTKAYEWGLGMARAGPIRCSFQTIS